MSPYKYWSELLPFGADDKYDDYITEEVLKLSTVELREEFTKLSEELDYLRQNEPSKKRGRELEYRTWVERTHNFRDRLNAIAKELEQRNNKTIADIKLEI